MEIQNVIGEMNRSLHGHSSLNEEMLACIRNCQESQQMCLQMIQHCLSKGGAHAEAKHIQLLIDCAQMCETSISFMTRQSSLHNKVCELCAEACKACAEDCERLGDDAMMVECAATCRRSEQSCRQMAAMSH